MPQLFTNNAVTTLSSGIAAGDLSITVANGALFPSPTAGDYFLLTLTNAGAVETSWEIVKVTARSGNVLTVVRAQEGTTAAAWTSGSKAELRITAETMRLARISKSAYRFYYEAQIYSAVEMPVYRVDTPSRIVGVRHYRNVAGNEGVTTIQIRVNGTTRYTVTTGTGDGQVYTTDSTTTFDLAVGDRVTAVVGTMGGCSKLTVQVELEVYT